MKRVIVYCLLAATMAACSGTKSASGKQVTFEQLKQSDFGGREEKSIAMITTTEDLAKLYSEMGWDAIPKVDFEKNNVVGDFQFIVLEKYLSHDNELPFLERIIMKL